MADAKLVVQVEGRDNLSQELKRIESGVIRFVGAIASAATAITAIGFPIVKAAEFQRELLNTAKTTDFARDSLVPLANGLRELSTQINVTAVDLAKIATMGGQIGIGKAGPAALLEFTKTVATAVSALDLSAEEVVASFGKLVNIFNIQPDQFRNAMSALNEVSNVSNATADQLFDVVRRIGNLGGAVTLPQAAALSATMIDLGFTAETAGTSLTKLFADFASNASGFAALMDKEVIESTEDWVRIATTDGRKAIELYVDALNNLPADQAAAAMVSLTGSGRMFSMVQKLREQRTRELAVLKQVETVEASISAITSGRVVGSADEVKALQERKKVLEEAAREANVLSRLTKSAVDAYRTGDSAEKEQRTVLSSLTAQWRVFLNNIANLAMAVGDVFLPPLTGALQDMSKALQDPVNADSLKRAAADVLSAVTSIIDVIKELADTIAQFRGGGFDFGSILRVGSLIAAMAAFKGLISILGAVGRSFVAGVPGINALGVALFGAVEQADNAAKKLDSVGASAARTGGLVQKAAERYSAASAAFLRDSALTARRQQALPIDTRGAQQAIVALQNLGKAAGAAVLRTAEARAEIGRTIGFLERQITTSTQAIAVTLAASARMTQQKALVDSQITQTGLRLLQQQRIVEGLFATDGRLAAFRTIADGRERELALVNQLAAAQARYNTLRAQGGAARWIKEDIDAYSRALAEVQKLNAQTLQLRNLRQVRGGLDIDTSRATKKVEEFQKKIAAYQQRIVGLQQRIPTLDVNTEKGLAEIRRLSAEVAQWERRVARLNKASLLVQAKVDATSVEGQLRRLVALAAQYGSAAGRAFTTGAQAGISGQTAAMRSYLVSVAGAARNTGRAVWQAIATGFKNAAQNAITSVEMVVGSLGGLGAAADGAKGRVLGLGAALKSLSAAGIGAGLDKAAGGLASVLAGVAAGIVGAFRAGGRGLFAALGAGFTALSGWVKKSILETTGFGKAWEAATGRAAKGVVLLGVAFTGLAKAIGLVYRTALSFVNVAFFGWLIVDLLKMVGLWDKVALQIQKVFTLLGMEVPSFLRTEEQEREAARATDAVKKMYEGAAKEAAKFNSEAKTTLLLTEDWQNVVKSVTFDPKQPTLASEDTVSRFKAIVAAYARVTFLTGQIKENEIQIALAQKDVEAARRRADSGRSGVQFGIESSKATKDAQARLTDLVNKAKEYNSLLNEVAGSEKALANLLTASLTQNEARVLLSRDWVDGANDGLSVLEQITRLESERLRLAEGKVAAEDELKRFGDRTGATVNADVLELRAALISYDELIAKNQAAQDALRTTLGLASEGGDVLLQTVNALNASADRGGVDRLVSDLQRFYAEQRKFLGLRVAPIKANDVVTAAVTAEVSSRFAKMYSTWANAAETAAERAKNYAVQVAGEISRLFESTTKSVEGTERALAAAALGAKRTLVDRERKRETDERLRQIDVIYNEEADRIRQVYAARQDLMDEELAANERARQRAKEPVQDAADFAAAKAAITDQMKIYRQLIEAARGYKEEIVAGTRVLEDPKASLEARVAAEKQIRENVERLKNAYDELSNIRAQFVNAAPVGGRVLFTSASSEIQEVTAGLAEVEKAIRVVALTGTNTIRELYQEQASTYRTQAQLAVAEAEAAFGRFNSLLNAQGGATQTNIRAIALALAQAGSLEKVLNQIDQKLLDGLIDPSSIDVKALATFLQQAVAEAAKVKPVPIDVPVNLTVAEEGMVEKFVTLLGAGLQKSLQQAKAEVSKGEPAEVSAKISRASLDSMRDSVEGLNPNIKGTLTITNQPEVVVKGKLVTEGTGGNARGGLIGETIRLASTLVGFARGGYAAVAPERLITPLARTAARASQVILQPISNFAAGGSTPTRAVNRVKGPGTGTSDSILSWLSNGEYVIDALTTARFGPEFFRRLQMAARGGVSTRVLQQITLPKFAVGGPVSEPVFALPDAADGVPSTVVTEHAVSLTINGKPTGRLRGSRETVKSLVSALKELERGVS